MRTELRTSFFASSLLLGASLAATLELTACSSGDSAHGGGGPEAGTTGGATGSGGGGASSGGASSGGASSGGASSGGASSGGASSGGASSGGAGGMTADAGDAGETGGTTGSGGDAGTGGSTSSGGTTGGGDAGTGGSTSSGGTTGTGGASASGGSGNITDAGNGTDGCVPSEDLTVPSVPGAVSVPSGTELLHHFHAMGVQIYECTATAVAPIDGGPANAYDWGGPTHKSTPEAYLYDSCGHRMVHHFAGPTWQSIADGSQVVGTKVGAVAQAGTIPWLLLSGAPSGSGMLSDVSYIQRLNTTGGAAPSTGCDSTNVGATTSVAYTADYYFYVTPTDGGADGGP